MWSKTVWILILLAHLSSINSVKYEDCEQPPNVANSFKQTSTDAKNEYITVEYVCEAGYRMAGKNTMTCDLDTDEWYGEPPTCQKDASDDSDKSATDGRKRKKMRMQDIQEETGIESGFAKKLDLTCMSKGLVRAPDINDGYIVKYNRRKFDGNIFLVAFYECDENYELENLENNRLFCSNEKWIGEFPVCMSINGDEDEDEEEYDESGGEEEEEEEEGAVNSHNAQDTSDNEIDANLHKDKTTEERPHENNEKHANEVIEENEAPTCGLNRGGCDQECQIEHRKIVCSCRGGFELDEADGKTCHDRNECSEENGGCSQNCNNLLGSFECSCYHGFRPDPASIHLCIDIDECLDPSIEEQCDFGCENTPGSYRCRDPPPTTTQQTTTSTTTTTEAIPTTSTHHNEENEEDHHRESEPTESEEEEEDQEGNESDDEEEPEPRRIPLEDSEDEADIIEEPHHSSSTLVHLTSTTTETSEISNEIDEVPKENSQEHEENSEELSNEVETARAHVEETSTYPSSTVDQVPDSKCQDGLRSNEEGKCVDINECDEMKTECEFCENLYGGYECTCPDGYELNDDEKTCRDINECEIYIQSENYSEENYDDEEELQTSSHICSHECINTVGSYKCKCPELFHLHDDKRTCIRDFCEDLNNPELNKTKCTHTCSEGREGFQCSCPEDMELQNDYKTCKKMSEHSSHHESHETDHKEEEKVSETHHKGSDSSETNEQIHHTHHENSNKEEEDEEEEEEEEEEHEHKQERKHDPNINTPSRDSCSGKEIEDCSPGRCVFNSEEKWSSCECPDGFIEKSNRCVDWDDCEHGTHNCSVNCHNTIGSFECSCPPGLVLHSDGRNCDDFNECEFGSAEICGELECLNTHGSYKCVCQENMELDEHGNCVEKSLCYLDNGGCSHECHSHYETVICECPEDMKLESDEKSCVYSDPCRFDNGGCSDLCNSTADTLCSCPLGFNLDSDERSCIDINECLTNNGGCVQLCRNSHGSFKCECKEGFHTIEENGHVSCTDIDECLTNNGECDHFCVNDDGGSHCTCRNGYSLNDDDSTCDDVNECETKNGGCSHRCLNLPGSYQCSCPYGQVLIDDEHTCGFIDLCEINNGGCSQNCRYTEGKVICSCRKGYQIDEDDTKNCVDLDECEEKNGGCSQICKNAEGSFDCDCFPGYQISNDQFSCKDADECIENNGNCSNICVNLIGSHSCACEAGFKLDFDNKTCFDTDECKDMIHDCSHNCINVPGTYECDCPEGFILGRDQFTCTDIVECDNNNGGCSHQCSNTVGSFKCLCEKGYLLDEDGKSCNEINECSENNGGCSDQCVNTPGSFHCQCREGLILKADNKTCDTLDLCLENNGGCDHLCLSENSKVTCSCQKGFQVNPTNSSSCFDINECSEDTHSCQQSCINTIGSFRCECYQGYRLNEQGQCVDLNECQMYNTKCPSMAQCINTPGSYRCNCPEGFKLTRDRKYCLEVKDQCQPLKAPQNGHLHCARSRHKTQLFYRTKCSFACDKGFKLDGPLIRHCNGSGHWDNLGESKCTPASCPRLTRPEHGTILPVNCMIGKTFVSERCFLHCAPGYKPLGKRVATCDVEQNWQPKQDLQCVPTKARPLSAPIHALKPKITCPQDMTLELPTGHDTVLVKLEKPKTNVDWWKFVDAYPSWGKKLEANLGIGVTEVTFRARSSSTNIVDICRVVITVIEPTPPKVTSCPDSFEVQLSEDEIVKPIYWKEASFESVRPIKQVFKSKVPGHKFGAGVHFITYVATTEDGQTAKCNFRITVRAFDHPRKYNYDNQISEVHDNARPLTKPMEEHESYLVCPGKHPVKIESHNPLHLPRGCVLKNIRVRSRDPAHGRPPMNSQEPRFGSDGRPLRKYNSLRYYNTWGRMPPTQTTVAAKSHHYSSNNWQ